MSLVIRFYQNYLVPANTYNESNKKLNHCKPNHVKSKKNGNKSNYALYVLNLSPAIFSCANNFYLRLTLWTTLPIENRRS